MQADRQQYLGAAPYQRTPDRHDQANGYKPKTVKTRMGEITFDVPQVRASGFYPAAFEKGLRSERALTVTLAGIYIQGVSTYEVTAVLEQLCGTSVSSARVSKEIAMLDMTLEAWGHRLLIECPYVILDSRYEKVCQDGQVRKTAILVASGIDLKGKRHLLGVLASLGEHAIHWRIFQKSLITRGLQAEQLTTSDCHQGLKATRATVFGGVPWQQC
jgi:putative transposase